MGNLVQHPILPVIYVLVELLHGKIDVEYRDPNCLDLRDLAQQHGFLIAQEPTHELHAAALDGRLGGPLVLDIIDWRLGATS